MWLRGKYRYWDIQYLQNGCVYCYANYSKTTVDNQTRNHNPKSPLLFGEVGDDDAIKERKMESLIKQQLTIFDI